jgi:integrase
MAKHPSLIQEALRRFDGLKAFGESRHALKAAQRDALRAQGQPVAWSHSTGKIHSLGTADTYKRQVLDYCAWARATYGIRHLADLDTRSSELAHAWLRLQLAERKSPHTIQMQRSALRMFHADRALGADVKIPRRRREAITRSRGETAADRRIDPQKYHSLIAFLHATGLRRREVASLRVGQVDAADGRAMSVWIPNGKGGKARTVIVLFGAEEAVRAAIAGKNPDEKVFATIPVALDVHACRRSYAQALYKALSGRPLPPARGRLPPGSYDRAAVEMVSWSLGHRRTDVVLRHYLR